MVKVHIIAEKKDKEQFTHILLLLIAVSSKRLSECMEGRGVAQEVMESGQYAWSQLHREVYIYKTTPKMRMSL